jgi:atypical dual specificity phosphatase
MSREALQQIAERWRTDRAFRERVRADPRAALAAYDLTEEELRHIILPNFGWLIEGTLAGVGWPGSAEAMAVLYEQGVRALVSLSEESLDPALLAAAGMRAVHFPVPDFTAPTIEQVAHALNVINGWLAEGLPVAVHCTAGQGRTGTILACYLVCQGMTAEAAIAEVRKKRRGSIETAEQERLITEYHRLARQTAPPAPFPTRGADVHGPSS